MVKTMVTNISCSQIMIFNGNSDNSWSPRFSVDVSCIFAGCQGRPDPAGNFKCGDTSKLYLYSCFLTKNDDQPVDLVNHGVTLEMKPIEMGSSSHHGLCEAGKQRHGSKLGPTTMV